MEQDKQQRRVKVVGEAATHRVGTKRAAVKPHKSTDTQNVGQIINDCLSSLRGTKLTQTYTGSSLTQYDKLLRTSFRLDANDEIYLLTDPTGTGKAGVLLSASGVHVADGKGTSIATSWKDFAKTGASCQRGMLVIGQNGIVTRDAQAVATLLQQVQAKLAQ